MKSVLTFLKTKMRFSIQMRLCHFLGKRLYIGPLLVVFEVAISIPPVVVFPTRTPAILEAPVVVGFHVIGCVRSQHVVPFR